MSPQAHPSGPRQLFFQTPEQRTDLARTRFFEEGQRPSGLVSEAVIQSWLRCSTARRRPVEAVAFEPVSRSRAHATLNRNRQLLQAGNAELGHLEVALGGTDCRVLLTDAHGVIIHATALPDARHQPLLRAASRVGVNVAEHQMGTSAPGIVVRTGQACTVDGGEHFHQCLQDLHCAAAPIRDIHGQLAGVLDVSVEGRRFPFDAAAVVGTYAATIENSLLQLQATQHLVLSFQASPTLLGTSMQALAGIDDKGQVRWLNAVAQRLTDVGSHQLRLDCAHVFGATLDQLLALLRQPQPQTLRLPSGLGVWVKARLNARDGVDFNQTAAIAPGAATPTAQAAAQTQVQPQTTFSTPPAAVPQTLLVEHSQRLIEHTLAECGGNIAAAARSLGVSRGMLYRRLKARGVGPRKEDRDRLP